MCAARRRLSGWVAVSVAAGLAGASSASLAFEPGTWFKPGVLVGFADVKVGMSPAEVAFTVKEPPDARETSEVLGVAHERWLWRTSDYLYSVRFLLARVAAKSAQSRKVP